MKYMLMIYMEENALNETERAECYVKSTALAHQLKTDGQFLATAPLHPVTTATSVRVRDGKRLITDGPFAETFFDSVDEAADGLHYFFTHWKTSLVNCS